MRTDPRLGILARCQKLSKLSGNVPGASTCEFQQLLPPYKILIIGPPPTIGPHVARERPVSVAKVGPYGWEEYGPIMGVLQGTLRPLPLAPLHKNDRLLSSST